MNAQQHIYHSHNICIFLYLEIKWVYNDIQKIYRRYKVQI